MVVLRRTAVCPLAFAVISFALSLVLLLAGSKPGYLTDDFMISVSPSTHPQTNPRTTLLTHTPVEQLKARPEHLTP
jgi:hypothetical protein